MASVTRHSEGSFAGARAARLAYRSWELADPRAVLVVVHGLGDHSGRYAGFGEHMARCGVSTFALDLPGHGRSDGRRGHITSFDIFLRSVEGFTREVDGRVGPGTPLFLLGHSMGGLVALRYLQEYNTPWAGAIIISPWLATAMPVPRLKELAAPLLSKLLPSLPFGSGIDAADLSHDNAVVEAYRADPLVHASITPRLFAEVSAAMSLTVQRGDRIDLPLFVMLAGSDRIVDTNRSLRFARSITAADCTVKVYPDAFHELLNEVDRADIHREVSEWIAARS